MTKKRTRLVISDFHLGAGPTRADGGTNYLEDFCHDAKLVEFIDYHSCGEFEKAEVELVINGDFFNHLQVWPGEKSPELMTEEVALARTEAIMAGHRSVFDALARFAMIVHHSVTFLIGNHDIGLIWPSVRKMLEEKLGSRVHIHPEPVYLKDGVWIEHGNQHVAENRIDFKQPFLTEGFDDPIVNLPWGDLFVIRFLNKVKKERPYVDKVYPFRLYLRWALIHDTGFAIRAAVMGCLYFMAVLFRIGENKRFARQQFMKIVKEFSFPVKMDRAAKRIFALHPTLKIVVFGHGHKAAARLFAGGKEYFNSGIWNEMISLDIGTMGRHLALTFIDIRYDEDGQPHGTLKEWKGRYREVEELGLL